METEELPKTRTEFIRQKDKWWDKYFQTDKFNKKERKFDYEIQTDGKAVSVLLR